MKNINKQSGQVSRTVIILVFVILLMAVVVYGVIRYAAGKKNQAQTPDEQTVVEPPKPVYEATIGDVRFVFESAIDLGSVIKAKTSYQQDIKTTEKFIKVTIRAQNKGKVDLPQYTWDIGNIVDSTGRNFIPSQSAYYFLPQPDTCGKILKPEFEPTPCVRIYEVSKVSDHLKIEVNALVGSSSKKQEDFLDLKLR